MPIAAVPNYLGRNFKDASPALRFGMLLPIWTERQDQEKEVNARANKKSREAQEVRDTLERQGMDATIKELRHAERNPLPGLWDKNDYGAKTAWDNIKALTPSDKKRMEALALRQQRLAASPAFQAHMLALSATATAPFTTGLGNEHPLENGFAFLTPYGLPYLAGSGVKGVLRQAARELARGEWGDTRGWNDERINALFGHEAGDEGLIRGVLDFWDVIPQIEGGALAVEVMTPHQTHYYQPKKPEDKNAGKSTSPHDSGQPNPITFLTVPPGSAMNFYVRCDEARLKVLAPELLESWRSLLTAAFEYAFEWLGFGAKTAVGYGAMQRDEKEESRQRSAAEEAQKAAEKAARESTLSPAMRAVSAFEEQCAEEHRRINGKRNNPYTAFYAKAQELLKAAREGEWSADEQRAAAVAIETWLPQIERLERKDVRKKLKLAELAPPA